MNRPLLLQVAALSAAAVLASASPAALAVDGAQAARPPVSPAQPKPRTGAYKVVKRGPQVTRAKCAEGGNVFTPSHEKGGPAQRASDVRADCKNIDYTK